MILEVTLIVVIIVDIWLNHKTQKHITQLLEKLIHMTAEEQLHETSVALEKTKAEVNGLSQEVGTLSTAAKAANVPPDVTAAIDAVANRAMSIADSLPVVVAPPAAEGASSTVQTIPSPPHKTAASHKK